MTCKVKVENGTIRLPPGLHLPDGAEVQLTVPDAVGNGAFAERYAAFVGAVSLRARQRVELPLIRGDGQRLINPTPEELDASAWGD